MKIGYCDTIHERHFNETLLLLDAKSVSLRNPNTTSCIVEYIESKLGCSPNIIGSNKRSPMGPCRTSGQLAELAELSRKLDEADDTAIFKRTGYEVLVKTNEEKGWNHS